MHTYVYIEKSGLNLVFIKMPVCYHEFQRKINWNKGISFNEEAKTHAAYATPQSLLGMVSLTYIIFIYLLEFLDETTHIQSLHQH